jgi:D-alanyl-D-alanine carboxypeptidase
MKDSQPVKIKQRKFKRNNKNSAKPKPTPPPVIPAKAGIQIQKIIKTKILKFDLQLTLIPLIILCFTLIAIASFNILLRQKIEKEQLLPLQYTIKLTPYPFMDKITNPDISAQSAIITDAGSHTVLYSKNPDLRFSMASTTKIMTALVALDYYQDKSILTIYSPHIKGSNIGFHQGEKFYFKDLLYAMLLPSSNEAAYAIAENYPGGKDAFIRKMNQKARELNILNTHYEDPAGLDDDNNYSTVLDLSHLAADAIKNKNLSSIFATKHKTITDITGTNVYQLENLNKLLGENGVNGIKTGTTEGAGEVLVTSKVENTHTFIIIVMKSTERFVDTKILLSLINKNVHFYNP